MIIVNVLVAKGKKMLQLSRRILLVAAGLLFISPTLVAANHNPKPNPVKKTCKGCAKCAPFCNCPASKFRSDVRCKCKKSCCKGNHPNKHPRHRGPEPRIQNDKQCANCQRPFHKYRK